MHAIVGDLDRVVLAHLMRHAIRRIQSGTRSGHQRHSATQKGRQDTLRVVQSVAIRGGNQWQSHSEWCNTPSGPQRQ